MSDENELPDDWTPEQVEALQQFIQTIGEAIEQSVELRAEGRFAEGLNILDKTLIALEERGVLPMGMDRKLTSYLLAGRSDFHRDLGQFEAAIADIRRCIELDFEPGEQRRQCAMTYADAGDIPGAIAELDAALSIQSGSGRDFSRRGALRFATNDLAGAAADFERAIESEPDLPEAHYGLGALKWSSGDLGAALRSIARACEVDPECFEARVFRHLVERAAGRRITSIPSPGRGDGHRNLMLNFLRGEVESTEVLAAVTANRSNSGRMDETAVRFYLGAEAHLSGDTAFAREQYERGLAKGVPYVVEFGLAQKALERMQQGRPI